MSDHHDRKSGLFWGVIITLVGFLFLFDRMNILDIGDLWPLGIIAVGIWMIIKAKYRSDYGNGGSHGMGDQAYITDNENVIHSNTFGDVKVTIKSKDFKSGQIRTTFGDVKVDLTELEIRDGEQILRMSTTFGDIKISTPKELAFSLDGTNTAGDMKIFDEKRSGWRQTVSYKSENYDSSAKRLKIITSQVFGDLKVW
jgi:predicted membrane protein